MTNKIVAIQGNHPSLLNPKTDTSIFLAKEIQSKYRIFYYDPKNLSIIKLPKFGLRMYPISLSMRKKIKSFNADVIYLKGLWRQTSLEAYFWKKTNPNKILIVSPAGMLQTIPLKNKALLKSISIFPEASFNVAFFTFHS